MEYIKPQIKFIEMKICDIITDSSDVITPSEPVSDVVVGTSISDL